ncbi:MAG: aldehyde dehydrogenase family protein [Gammaproteobacteria bacterium]
MGLLRKLGIKNINPGAYAGALWHSSTQVETFSSINPATEKEIAKIAMTKPDDYERVIQIASDAFKVWREVPAPERGEVVRQIGQALRDKKDFLGSLVSMENGKSKQEGDGEVQEMIDLADFAVGQSRMLYGKTMHSERRYHRMYEQWHPYGIVGVISAFNFPVAVWSWNAFIAAICGNVTLWKPSSSTALCAIAVQNICNEVLKENNYPEIFNLLIDQDHSLGETMIADQRVPLVSFTGSTRIGRHVAQVVSQRLGRTILELGGNNAIIVDESADFELVIPAIVFGATGTAGQRCTSTRRLIVHETVYAQLLEEVVHAYHQIKIGDPMDEKNLMGPLINKKAVENYVVAIAAAQEQGGKIAYGGHVLSQAGYYVEPTIVTNLEAQSDIVQQETFAPILYIMPYQHIEEAIAIHNDVPQGLSSAIFTNDLQHAEQFLSGIGSDCGIANVNIGTSGAEIGGAFGGEKETGGGRESGSDAWKAYMRRQTNTINWGKTLPLAQGIQFSLSKD